jgi:hypothetical protein
MEGKPGPNQSVIVVRIAWMATFVVPLVLAGLLLAVKTAHATPAGPTIVPLAFEEEFELEDEGEGEGNSEDECAEATKEFEEGDLEEADLEDICEEAEDQDKKRAAGPGAVAPEECLVRSARARVVAYATHNTVRLTVGYTTYEPTTATIEYDLTGGKGSLHLGTEKRHLGRSGVLRVTTNLSDPQMSKVKAAGHFTVRLHSAEAPGSCRSFETEQLTVKHASKRLAVWAQAG